MCSGECLYRDFASHTRDVQSFFVCVCSGESLYRDFVSHTSDVQSFFG